jgi:hypothetical protein
MYRAWRGLTSMMRPAAAYEQRAPVGGVLPEEVCFSFAYLFFTCYAMPKFIPVRIANVDAAQ